MESISEFASNVNWEALVQLSMVAAIMIAGPVVIFLLAFRGGNL
ncbi:MAG TPA: photosystem II reaction center protein Ycf12 [Thermosynechococcaceae cyanobacterium]